MTPKQPIEVHWGGRVLAESPACLLLVAWVSFMTPSHTVMPACISAWIRLKKEIGGYT
jgi:hypothetical protein